MFNLLPGWGLPCNWRTSLVISWWIVRFTAADINQSPYRAVNRTKRQKKRKETRRREVDRYERKKIEERSESGTVKTHGNYISDLPFPDLAMQSTVDSRDRNRSGIHDCLVMSDRMRIDENAANNGQPTDNSRVMVNEGNCTPLQVQKAMRNAHSRPGKRPIKNVSPAEKVDAIDRVHDGESKASVARDIGIPESTLRGWCKSEQKIRSQCNNMSTDMINRHCSININNSRPTNSRHLVNIWDSSNNQSSDTPSCDNGPPAKRAKVERTNRQSSSQTVMPGPSTSSANEAYINSNYVPFVASSMNSMPTMSLHEQHQVCRFLTTLKEVLLQRNSSMALVEDGLNCTKTNNTASSTIASNSAAINIANNIREIDRMQTAMKNVFGNTIGNAFNYTVGSNRNIAVAPTQGTSSTYTRKSPSVKPAAEAPTTPAPASPHENNVHPREAGNTTDDNTNTSGDPSWMHFVQQMTSAQQFRGHYLADVSNIPSSRKNWYWQQAKWSKSPTKITDNMLTYMNYLANNNNFANVVSNSENRTHSRSVASEETDSREGRENLPSEATPERATLPTPSTMGPRLTSGVMKELQAAKTDPSNSDIEKAIRYSTWLQEWFDKCSIPLLTDSQVLHHKRIAQILESVKNLSKAQKVESESCVITARPRSQANQL